MNRICKTAFLSFMLFLASFPLRSQPASPFFPKAKLMQVGAYYYPEHWPETQWGRDLDTMKELGFEFTHVGEFAWAFMEPEEGRFDLDWLDDALKILGAHGIQAVLGTPTAAMPAWVARKYPETLATQKDGTRITWGARKNSVPAKTRVSTKDGMALRMAGVGGASRPGGCSPVTG